MCVHSDKSNWKLSSLLLPQVFKFGKWSGEELKNISEGNYIIRKENLLTLNTEIYLAC